VAVVVAGIAVDEPARPRCADAAAAAPAAADAEIGEDDAPGRAAPQLVPAAAPIADTPSRSSSDYLTRASNYFSRHPLSPPFPRARNVQRGRRVLREIPFTCIGANDAPLPGDIRNARSETISVSFGERI